MTQPTRLTVDDARQWLLRQLPDYLDTPSSAVASDTPLTDYGLTSVNAVALCAAIEDHYGVDCDIDTLWRARTVDGVAAHLATLPER